MKKNTKARNEVRSYLLLKNLTLEQFCERYGFNRRTVESVIDRYWYSSKQARGEITLKILETLKKYTQNQ